jgi:hypothetical protein
VLTSGSNAGKKLSQEVSRKIKGYFPPSWIFSPKMAIVMYIEMLLDFKNRMQPNGESRNYAVSLLIRLSAGQIGHLLASATEPQTLAS